MKKLLPLIFLFLPLCLSGADAGERPSSWQVQWSSSARIGGSSGKYMPYFSRTGEDGILPVRSSGLLTAGAKVSYSDMKGFFFDTEAALAGALALKSPLYGSPVYGLVDRLYVSGGWRMLRMEG